MNKTFTKENMLLSFPYPLSSDEHIISLAETCAVELEELWKNCSLAGIYNRIEELDEKILDILAVDFNVSWYSFNASVAVKRALIKTSFYVHRRLGTKDAMKKALSATYSGIDVSEWFEYNGKPHHFKISLDLGDNKNSFSDAEAIRYIRIFKPVRSKTDGIFASLSAETALAITCRSQIVKGDA